MRKILIIRFSSLGDIVLTEPIVRQLRKCYPEAEIHYTTKAEYSDLVQLFEGITAVHLLPSSGKVSALADELKPLGFDLIVDLHNNIRSVQLSTALKVKTVRAAKESLKRLAVVRFKWMNLQPSHAISRYAHSLSELGIDLDFSSPKLVLPDELKQWWQQDREKRDCDERYYCIAPGATYQTKRAPDQLWCTTAKLIQEQLGLKALVVGAPAESEMMADLEDALEGNCAGVTCEENIGRSAAILAASEFVLSNDSGVAHMAAALCKPTLALFGPTHPKLGFAPRGDFAEFYSVNEFCSPCSRHGDKPCYRDDRYCFSLMKPQEIVDRIHNLSQRAARMA